jgi:hypothetical protein
MITLAAIVRFRGLIQLPTAEANGAICSSIRSSTCGDVGVDPTQHPRQQERVVIGEVLAFLSR